MKKVLLTLAVVLGSMTLMAQQPERPILHNQFRDYVEFRKRQEMNFEKPNVQHKDGKVLITMSEEQFAKMRQIQMRQRGFHPIGFRQPTVCQNCKKCKKQMMKRKSPMKNF